MKCEHSQSGDHHLTPMLREAWRWWWPGSGRETALCLALAAVVALAGDSGGSGGCQGGKLPLASDEERLWEEEGGLVDRRSAGAWRGALALCWS